MSIHNKLIYSLALAFMGGQLAFSAEVAPQSAADLETARPAFVAAMQRVRLHLADVPDPPALVGYPIYAYLTAARLRRDLAAKPGEELDPKVDAFLQAHGGEPVARTLRHDWLLSLAARGRWDWFLPRSLEVTDAQLMCARFDARLTLGDTVGLAGAALARWSLPQRPPAECGNVFAWLRQQGLLTPALAEGRTRAALEADNPRLAREFTADVPIARTAALLQWSDLLESPRSALNVLATHPNLPVEPAALAAGFEKLTRADSDAALRLLPQLLVREAMPPALQAKLRRTAALGAAYDHEPRALDAFDALPPDAIDAPVEEWRVRAALWAGDFVQANAWLTQMRPALANLPRWRYWRARAVAATAGEEAAKPLFAEIAGLRDYYGYLAADRLRQAYDLNARASPDDIPAQTALAATAELVRAHALFDCDMVDDAQAEWAVVLAAAEPSVKIQAAHLAARWGWYAQSIAVLAQAGEFDDVRLRYPHPYAQIVADASKLSGVPADWILGVMRQESLFRKDAVSRADARGLMQMLPATAVAVARRWNLAPPSREALFDPSVGVPLGAAYLRELLDRQASQLDLTLGAYNAGPAAVARWLPSKTMDADIWIENIPYNETRSYVQHILEHIVAFAFVAGAELPRLETLLAPIESAAVMSQRIGMRNSTNENP